MSSYNIIMNFSLKKDTYQIGEIISDFIKYLVEKYEPKNILFIRTPTTGEWLDNLFVNDSNIERILYDTNTTQNYSYHDSTLKIKHITLKHTLELLDKKFDLICMDTFHDYDHSANDFNLMSSHLSDNGFIVSHDCFPSHEILASPTYMNGEWCGETYVAFINFAYTNPDYFYGLFNVDTGIAVISKTRTESLKNNFNREKQQHFLSCKNNRYKYFIENCNEMMNIITL